MKTPSKPPRRIRWKLWIIPGVLLLLPAWGFYYGLSHAYLSVTLHDVAAVQDQNRVRHAKLTFLDEAGVTLASAHTDPQYGSVEFDYPDFGACAEGKSGQERWQACNEERSRWFAEWLKQLAMLNLSLPDCMIRKLPVMPEANRDMAWTWWIPHREIGGTPNTYYSLYLQLDGRQCRIVSQH